MTTPDPGKETFVYDGVEVYKTGRVASQQVTKARKTALAKRNALPDQMIEVKPVDGEMSPFKFKWVKEESLYKVGENPGNSGEIELLER